MDGTGARLWGGRWNSPGIGPIYTAENYSGALLEILVNKGNPSAPQEFQYCSIDVPDSVAVEDSGFPPEELDGRSTAVVGDKWWKAGKFAVLRVPSAVTRIEYNFLINPLHEAYRHIKASHPKPVWMDSRLTLRLKRTGEEMAK